MIRRIDPQPGRDHTEEVVTVDVTGDMGRRLRRPRRRRPPARRRLRQLPTGRPSLHLLHHPGGLHQRLHRRLCRRPSHGRAPRLRPRSALGPAGGSAQLRRRRIHPQNRFVQALDQRPAGGGLGLTYQLRPEQLDCHVLPAQGPRYRCLPCRSSPSAGIPRSPSLSRSPPAPRRRKLFA